MGVYTSLEVAVAGEDGGHDDIALVHSFGDGIGKRSRIADAGGAAIAHKVEPQRIEILLQTGRGVIVRNHLASWCQRGLDPRFHRETALGGIARQQPGREHHAGFEVWVQLVMAAITTSPCLSS